MADLNEIIAGAVNPRMVGPAPLPLTAPPSLVDDGMLRNLLSAALATRFAPSPDDASTARFNIGMALMQPRMPGESVAGNVGKALGTGVSAWDAGAEKARTHAVQDAQLGIAAQAASDQHANSALNREVLMRKFPTEMATLEEHLKQLRDQGDISGYNALVARLKTGDPAAILEEITTGRKKAKAEVGKLEAETGKLTAEAGTEPSKQKYYEAYANYLNGVGRQAAQADAVKITNLDDGTALIHDRENGFAHFIPGMNADAAKKRAEKELRAQRSWYDFTSPSEQAVNELAKKYMEPKITKLRPDEAGFGSPRGATPAPGSPELKMSQGASGELPDQNAAQVNKGVDDLMKKLTSAGLSDDQKKIVTDELSNLLKSGKVAPEKVAAVTGASGLNFTFKDGKLVPQGAKPAEEPVAEPSAEPSSAVGKIYQNAGEAAGVVKGNLSRVDPAQTFNADARTMTREALKAKYGNKLTSLSVAQRRVYKNKVGE